MNVVMLSAAIRRTLGKNTTDLLGRELIAGDLDLGYYGVYTSAEVVSGTSLATLVGLTAGSSINATANWLGFALGGKKLFIAQRPFRYRISRESLAAKGLIYGKEITLQGKRFSCRLPRGLSSETPANYGSGNDHVSTHGSEWNKLLYRVTGGIGGVSGEGIPYGAWAQISETDMSTRGSYSRSHCMERAVNEVFAFRGESGGGVRYVSHVSLTNGTDAMVWRPVLELID